MTVAAALLLLGLLDAALAGFRASCGRTGLVDHRDDDRRALVRGLALGLPLLAPAVVLVLLDDRQIDRRAGDAMLAVYGPYGLLVLAALAAYGTLSWRRRFLATAALLGPLTLLRPLVALGGALAAGLAGDLRAGLLGLLAVTGVLAVEPLAGRFFYAPR